MLPNAKSNGAQAIRLGHPVKRLAEQQKDTSMSEQKQSLNTQLANAVAAVASAKAGCNTYQ